MRKVHDLEGPPFPLSSPADPLEREKTLPQGHSEHVAGTRVAQGHSAPSLSSLGPCSGSRGPMRLRVRVLARVRVTVRGGDPGAVQKYSAPEIKGSGINFRPPWEHPGRSEPPTTLWLSHSTCEGC